MEWTEEKMIKLIEQYRKFENLWNPTDINYFKRNEKVDAWEKIGIKINRSSDDCRKKIVSLLSSYRREKSRTKMSMRTGKRAAKIYRSRWFAYDSLKFLEDRDTLREKLDTGSLSTALTDGIAGNKEDIDNVGDNSQVTPSTSAGEMERTTFVNPRPPKRRRERADKGTELLKSAVNILKSTAGRLHATPTVADAEVQSFCAFLSSKMMGYPRNTRQRVQHEIYGLLMKADLGHFETQPTLTSLSPMVSHTSQSFPQFSSSAPQATSSMHNDSHLTPLHCSSPSFETHNSPTPPVVKNRNVTANL
ncbi:uncharacterized protein LOC117605803 [Osmia lignaria lignaria]|uniref:uncharacterized protein LOC117605803 n=1 Tax=Osmia lignaria lignaria TaxID=1437193 RepID=UPI00402B3B5C